MMTYEKPDCAYSTEKFKKLTSIRKIFYFHEKITNQEIRVNKTVMYEIISRVHQETSYYDVFYGAELAQSREAALMSYWILRYHPLIPVHINCSVIDLSKDFDVNVYFAYYCLLSEVLAELLPMEIPQEVRNSVVIETVQRYKKMFIRAFNEYSLEKESFILLSETLKAHVLCLRDLKLKEYSRS